MAIDYEEQTLRPRLPLPGGLNDPAALAGRVANAGQQVSQSLRPGNSFPSTTAVAEQAGQDFSRDVRAGEYGRAAGGTLRNTVRAIGGLAQDVYRPLAQFGQSAAQTAGNVVSGLTNAPAQQPIPTQSQVRAVDNTLAADQTGLPATALPQPATAVAPTVAPTAAANGGRPFALGSPEDTAFQTANLRANATAGGTGPSMSVIPDGSTARQDFFDNANLRTQAARSTYSPRKGYSANDAAIQAAALPVQNRAKLSELSLKNEGELTSARLQDATARRGQDVTAATQAHAQDVTLRGQDINARTAALQARQQQMQQDRQFNLEVQRFGQDTASKNFEIRQKAVKDVQDQVAGMLPPGPDGKPDAAAAARYSAGLNTLVGQRQEQLRAQLARTPDRADVKAELDALESKGLAAMDQAAIRKYVVGQQTAELAQQTGTSRFNPIGTAAANSTAPVTSLRERPGIFGSDYVSDRGDVIPARYLRNNGQLNQDLNTLIQR